MKKRMKRVLEWLPVYMGAACASAEETAQALQPVWKLSGGYVLLLVIAAAIGALAIVGGMQAQMKTAGKKESAGDYVGDHALQLQVKHDRFIRETRTRRKIEKKEDK